MFDVKILNYFINIQEHQKELDVKQAEIEDLKSRLNDTTCAVCGGLSVRDENKAVDCYVNGVILSAQTQLQVQKASIFIHFLIFIYTL